MDRWIKLLKRQGRIKTKIEFLHHMNHHLKDQSRSTCVLGLDIAETNIGVAFSDATYSFASPLKKLQRMRPTYRQDSMQNISSKLQKVIAEQQAIGAVVGWPLMPDGSLGMQCGHVLAFLTGMHQINEVQIPMVLWDERGTSVDARSFLWDAKTGKKRMKQMEDQVAAALILKDFLDHVKMLEDCTEEEEGK
mmetsp:Transcript_28457/g.49352  ORF Transcript_28457/g.49352 Transcript_28457/m.49352 type:complete len:192 (+) Transcript_28457:73-648(+)